MIDKYVSISHSFFLYKDLPALLPERTVYDIYHDPNVPEVIQCLPILDNLMFRVGQLLDEWPDHPTLKQVCNFLHLLHQFLEIVLTKKYYISWKMSKANMENITVLGTKNILRKLFLIIICSLGHFFFF